MGLIGMDEFGPMGVRPTGMAGSGGRTFNNVMRMLYAMQEANRQTSQPGLRQGAPRHPRTKREFGTTHQATPSLQDRIGAGTPRAGDPGYYETGEGKLQTGGGIVGAFLRAFGAKDTRTGTSTGAKSYEWRGADQPEPYSGRATGTALRFNPKTGAYETVNRYEFSRPPVYDNARYDVAVQNAAAAQARRAAELEARAAAAAAAKQSVQAAQAREAARAAEEARRQAEVARQARERAEYEAAMRYHQEVEALPGMDSPGAPQVVSVAQHQRPAVYVPPRAPVQIMHSAPAPQPAPRPTPSPMAQGFDWSKLGVDWSGQQQAPLTSAGDLSHAAQGTTPAMLAAIKARATHAYTSRVYQGAYTGAGPTYNRVR